MTHISAALLANLDQPVISAAIRTVKLEEHEYDTVSSIIMRAVDGFLADDLLAWDDCRVELTAEDGDFSWTFDLVLLRKTSGVSEAKIIDWKTTTATSFQPNYAAEHEHSWQTFMYFGFGAPWLEENYGASTWEMQYRALSPTATKIITVPVDAELQRVYRVNSQKQLEGVAAMYSALVASRSPSWPRTLPFPCHKGSRAGATCPFWYDCTHDSAPLVAITDTQVITGKPLRRSHVNQFLECPERYRRAVVLGDRLGSSNYDMDIGQATTAGLAEIWSQAFRLKNSPVKRNKEAPNGIIANEGKGFQNDNQTTS